MTDFTELVEKRLWDWHESTIEEKLFTIRLMLETVLVKLKDKEDNRDE